MRYVITLLAMIILSGCGALQEIVIEAEQIGDEIGGKIIFRLDGNSTRNEKIPTLEAEYSDGTRRTHYAIDGGTVDKIIDTAMEKNADIIGISALLTTTMIGQKKL